MKKTNNDNTNYNDRPETLDDHIFYGFNLDDEQREFVNAIWNPEKKVIFCDSRAGTGKTTLALGVANLLYKYGLYSGISYIVYPVQEKALGYLSGSLEEKSAPYMEPLYEALVNIGEIPEQVVIGADNSMNNVKKGTAYIQCMPHTFLRGCNFENRVIISDETQNGYISEIKKVLTRVHDSCKLIIIGHTGQKDLYKHSENSGFAKALELFASKNDPRVAICKLSVNHRGWISRTADELESEIK